MKTGSKKTLHILLSVIMIFSLLPVFGMTAEAASPLPGFVGFGGQIRWDPVPGADNYHLSGFEVGSCYVLKNEEYNFNGSLSWTSSGISFNLLKFMDTNANFEEKTYDLTVEAYKGSEKLGYASSFQYTYKSELPILDTPKNLRWNGTTVSWDAVSGADFYRVYLYNASDSYELMTDQVKKTSTDLSATSWFKNQTVPFAADGQYYYKVKAFQSDQERTARNSRFAVSETVTGNMVMSGYKTGDTFKVTVNDGTASKTSAKYGEKVTITASEKNGYSFYRWQVLTTGVTLGSLTSSKTSFTMPDRQVIVQATFRRIVDRVVLNITKPVAGEKPSASLFCAGAELSKLTWYRREMTERGIEEWAVMPSSASFQEGKRYLAKIELRPEADYVFPDQSSSIMVLFNGGQLGGGMTSLTADAMVIQKEFVAEAVNPFRDISSDKYYFEPVLWAVNHKPAAITTGTGKDTFSPDQRCTRGQVVTFLWRMAGCPAPSSSVCKFTDVSDSEYYYSAVLWAVEKNITNGIAADRFDPNGSCTRGQVVTFLHRYENKPKPASAVNPFKDVSGSDYFYDAVCWAVGKNITNGTSADLFSPNVTCSRAQIVTFLYRDETGK